MAGKLMKLPGTGPVCLWKMLRQRWYDIGMHGITRVETRCLAHQLPEDQASSVGMVCPRCKQRLYVRPPQGRCMSFWESQPVAYSLDGRPLFVYTLMWDDFRIRSLHLPDDDAAA